MFATGNKLGLYLASISQGVEGTADSRKDRPNVDIDIDRLSSCVRSGSTSPHSQTAPKLCHLCDVVKTHGLRFGKSENSGAKRVDESRRVMVALASPENEEAGRSRTHKPDATVQWQRRRGATPVAKQIAAPSASQRDSACLSAQSRTTTNGKLTPFLGPQAAAAHEPAARPPQPVILTQSLCISPRTTPFPSCKQPSQGQQHARQANSSPTISPACHGATRRTRARSHMTCPDASQVQWAAAPAC
ncbi:hypothetical protein SVAN01_02261 [Stagonosporopsis vannaccii]|nr:hypothetical protein SVAN01_02261 [Stagonosporopsis vannaccii]